MNAQRRSYPPEVWTELRCAVAAGVSLRAMAEKLGIPVGTALSRAKREGWTRQIEQARTIAAQQSRAITPPGTATAGVLAELGRKSRVALGTGLHKAAEHVASLDGGTIMQHAVNVASLAKAGGAVFGWDNEKTPPLFRLELIAAAAQGPVLDVTPDVQPVPVTPLVE